MPTVAPVKSPDRTAAAKDANVPPPVGPVSFLRRKCACGGGAGVDGSCDDCRQKRLQRKAAGPGSGAHEAAGGFAIHAAGIMDGPAVHDAGVPRAVQDVLGTPGRPLDPTARAFAEARFGQDFGQVRIHADDRAAASARAVDAHAYTVGSHVVFGAGRYAPGTRVGRWLLAHELAHVAQQRGSSVPPLARLAVGRENDPSEAAADRAADAAMAGGAVPSLSRSDGAIRRLKVTSVDEVGKDEKVAHLDNGTRVRIKRIRWARESESWTNWVEVSPFIDRQRIWLEVEWCADQNQGTVRIGANVPQEVLGAILDAVTSGGDLQKVLDGIDIKPFAEVEMLQSGEFRLKASGELSIDREGKVTGGKGGATLSKGAWDIKLSAGSERVGDKQDVRVEGGVTYTPGRKTDQKDCKRRKTRVIEKVRFECRDERDIPAKDVEEKVPVTDKQSRFIYFVYETDKVAPRSAANIASLTQDLKDGFQVVQVRGFTSPEGSMAKGRRFMGNEELARRRAAAAAKVAAASCKAAGVSNPDSCFVGGEAAVTPTGEGELYTLTALDAAGEPKEVEGAPLAEHAAAEFQTSDAEAVHRTKEITEKLEDPKTTSKQKADLVYPLLRRAEIALTRNRIETRTKHIEATVESTDTACSDEVIEATFPKKSGERGR